MFVGLFMCLFALLYVLFVYLFVCLLVYLFVRTLVHLFIQFIHLFIHFIHLFAGFLVYFVYVKLCQSKRRIARNTDTKTQAALEDQPDLLENKFIRLRTEGQVKAQIPASLAGWSRCPPQEQKTRVPFQLSGLIFFLAESYQWLFKLELRCLPCQASALGVVDPLSVYCGRVGEKV